MHLACLGFPSVNLAVNKHVKRIFIMKSWYVLKLH